MNVLPNSIEAEENVISAILVDNSNCKYIDKLEEIDFYNKKNQEIFKIIKELYNNDAPVDLLTVKEKGASKNFDPNKLMMELVRMTDSLALASNIEYYIKLLKNLSVRRQIYIKSNELCKEILEYENDKDELDIKNETIQKFMNIKIKQDQQYSEMNQVMMQTLEDIEKKYQKRDDLTYRTRLF